jgi:hypothetical protein
MCLPVPEHRPLLHLGGSGASGLRRMASYATASIYLSRSTSRSPSRVSASPRTSSASRRINSCTSGRSVMKCIIQAIVLAVGHRHERREEPTQLRGVKRLHHQAPLPMACSCGRLSCNILPKSGSPLGPGRASSVRARPDKPAADRFAALRKGSVMSAPATAKDLAR